MIITKSIKLRIFKPTGEMSWKELSQLLNDTLYCSCKMHNYSIREIYLNATIPNKDDRESSKELNNRLYSELVSEFPEMPGQLVNATIRSARKAWRQFGGDVLRLNSSLPTFKKNMPAELHNKSFKIVKDMNTYRISSQLRSTACEQTRYLFEVFVRDSGTRTILERILDGTYKQGAAKITKDRKGKWYFIISYSFEKESYDIDPEKVMGVDLGITKAAYWAYNHSFKRGYIDGGEIEAFEKKVTKLRRDIQHQSKHAGDSRTGHGVKRILQPTEALRSKEHNFRDSCNHRYARRIVAEALKMGCAVIQIEDLSGIANNTAHRFLKKWPYFDLQVKIENKAKEYGIEVIKVDPSYTSQRCSECGHISNENRKSQATFECTACGYGTHHICHSCYNKQESAGSCQKCGKETHFQKINADYNAARNLSIRNIDYIIQEELKTRART